MKDERAPGVRQVTATGPVIEVGGTVYRFDADTNDAKGRLESLIRAEVLDRMYAECDAMPAATAGKHEARVRGLLDAGHYDTFGDGWRARLGTAAGMGMLLASLLREHHPLFMPADAIRLLQADPRKVKDALREVMPDFFRRAMRANGATAEQIAAAEPAFAELVAALGTPEPPTASP